MKKKRLQRSDALWMTAVAVLILLQFWWLPGNPGTPDDTYSKTIEGKLGFFQTLEALSKEGLLPPVRRETTQLIPSQSSTLVMISPDRYPDINEQQKLATFVMNGGTLLFAPNWGDGNCEMPQLHIETAQSRFEDTTASTAVTTVPQASTIPAQQGSQTTEGQLTAEAESTDSPKTTLAEAPESDAPKTAEDESGQRIEAVKEEVQKELAGTAGSSADPAELTSAVELQVGSSLVQGLLTWRTRAELTNNRFSKTVLVETADGKTQAASWPFGRGLVVVCASPDVFSNASMLDPARAELAVRLVEHAHQHHQQPNSQAAPEIVVSEFLNTSDKYHGAAVLVSPTLRSGTLQLIMVAFLAGWYGFHRFGPIKRGTAKERRSLTESAESIGNLHFRTASGAESVGAYLDYVAVQLQKILGPSAKLDNTRLIATRAGLDAGEVTQVISTAKKLADDQTTSASMAATNIRKLSELLNRITGGGKG